MLKGGNDGFYLYTDALPSLDSATLTPQIYPEGKLRCSAPVFEPGGGGINVRAPLPTSAAKPRPFSRRRCHR
jgi:hypothetical protein